MVTAFRYHFPDTWRELPAVRAQAEHPQPHSAARGCGAVSPASHPQQVPSTLAGPTPGGRQPTGPWGPWAPWAHLSQTPCAQFDHSLRGKGWCLSQGPLQPSQLQPSLTSSVELSKAGATWACREATRPRVRSRALISWGLHAQLLTGHSLGAERLCWPLRQRPFMSHGPGAPRNLAETITQSLPGHKPWPILQ